MKRTRRNHNSKSQISSSRKRILRTPSNTSKSSNSELTPKECKALYAVEPYADGQVEKLSDIPFRSGIEVVRGQANEGMPIEIMGDYDEITLFRRRQKERSKDVPTDIERQNARSVQRNSQHTNGGFAGETTVSDSVRAVLSSPGQKLESGVKKEMEERMNEDFSDVQIHTGAQATHACEEINARAFTVGRHIAFNAGEYDPESAEGQYLIAHELAHTRQQRRQGAIHRMKGQKSRLGKLQKIANDENRYPGDEKFETELNKRIKEINSYPRWLKSKLKPRENFDIGDIALAMYAPGADAQTSRELVFLLEAEKWGNHISFDRGAPDWQHIVARHVVSQLQVQEQVDWGIEPGMHNKNGSASVFPSDMGPSAIKNLITKLIKDASKGNVKKQTDGKPVITYSGKELPKNKWIKNSVC